MRTASLNEVLSFLHAEIGKTKLRLIELEATRDTLLTLAPPGAGEAPAPMFSVIKTGAGSVLKEPAPKPRAKPEMSTATLRSRILGLLEAASDAVSTTELRTGTSIGPGNAIHAALYGLRKEGLIERVEPGLHRLKRETPIEVLTLEQAS